MKQIVVPLEPIVAEHRGYNAIFWALGAEPSSPQFGVKGFKKPVMTELARGRQAEGYRAGVAPPVGELVELVFEDGTPHPTHPAGYQTGVAERAESPGCYDRTEARETLRAKLLAGRMDVWRKVHAIMPPENYHPFTIDGEHFAGSKANDVQPSHWGLWQGRLVWLDWY